jgi:hypothetical protein
MTSGWLLSLCAVAAAAAKDSDLRQDISIRGKAAAGAGVQVSAPRADAAVTAEVVDSLDLTRKAHRAAVPHATVAGGGERLERPFPEAPFLTLSPRTAADAYDRWSFEVYDGTRLVHRQEGNGRLYEKLEWDGSGDAGRLVVQAGSSYAFRFTGWDGDRAFVISSDPVRLASLAYKEFLGETHLEAANDVLFTAGEASFKPGSDRFLTAMGDRMRRSNVQGEPYRLVLYQAKPRSASAAARGRLLRKYFAGYLVINPERVRVDVLSLGVRGDVTACVLPPERGDSIRTD